MRKLLLVGEDALSCALGRRVLGYGLPGWSLAAPPIDTRGVTKLAASIGRYVEQARHVQPVFCFADTDGTCAVELRNDLLRKLGPIPPTFCLRLAVPEAESWVLADRDGAAAFLAVPHKRIPDDPEQVPDPKRLILHLARLSKNRSIRDEVVSSLDINKPGAGYNVHLCRFVMEQWDAARAAGRSASLRRALARLSVFAAE